MTSAVVRTNSPSDLVNRLNLGNPDSLARPATQEGPELEFPLPQIPK